MKKNFILTFLFLSCQLLLATSNFYLRESISTDNYFLKKGTKVDILESLNQTEVKIKVPTFIDKKQNLYFDKEKIYKIGSIKKDINFFDFIIKKDQLTSNAIEVWEEEEELYLDACTQCHAEMEPIEHSMLEWEAIFNSMKEQSQLEKEDEEKILDYLKSHSYDGFVKTEE